MERSGGEMSKISGERSWVCWAKWRSLAWLDVTTERERECGLRAMPYTGSHKFWLWSMLKCYFPPQENCFLNDLATSDCLRTKLCYPTNKKLGELGCGPLSLHSWVAAYRMLQILDPGNTLDRWNGKMQTDSGKLPNTKDSTLLSPHWGHSTKEQQWCSKYSSDQQMIALQCFRNPSLPCLVTQEISQRK